MKKSISILVLLALVASGAFAQAFSLSAGGGVQFDLGVPTSDYLDGVDMFIGGHVFFDATYAELGAGVGYYRLTDPELYGAALRFSLLGKYPFDLGGFSLFPLLGIRFSVPLNMSYDGNSVDEFEVGDYVRFGFQVGAGADFPLGRSVFMRTSLLFNLDLFAPGEDPFDDGLYSLGPTVKVGVGYRF